MSEWNDASVPEKLQVLRQQILAVDRQSTLLSRKQQGVTASDPQPPPVRGHPLL